MKDSGVWGELEREIQVYFPESVWLITILLPENGVFTLD